MTWTYIITAASIIGTVANIYKKQWCFIVWLCTNSLWCVIDFSRGLPAQGILFAVYVGLSVWGLIKWHRGEND